MSDIDKIRVGGFRRIVDDSEEAVGTTWSVETLVLGAAVLVIIGGVTFLLL